MDTPVKYDEDSRFDNKGRQWLNEMTDRQLLIEIAGNMRQISDTIDQLAPLFANMKDSPMVKAMMANGRRNGNI